MGKYEIIGRTSVFFTDRAVGDVVEDDLDKDTERALLEAGVIRKLADEKKAEAKPAKKAKSSGARKSNS